MRRAGFGASREELEARAARGYEATVEELVNPDAEPVDRHDFYRYHPAVGDRGEHPRTLFDVKNPMEVRFVGRERSR
jgi:hypothetical protein